MEIYTSPNDLMAASAEMTIELVLYSGKSSLKSVMASAASNNNSIREPDCLI